MAPRLLIVDDDRSISRTLQLLVQSRGYEADICGTAAEALAALQEGRHQYVLILLDVRLPDASGFEVLEQMQPNLGSAAVALMSGYDADYLQEDPRAALARVIFTKPVPLDALWSLLKELTGAG